MSLRRRSRLAWPVLVFVGFCALSSGQSSPVPFINLPLVPVTVAPGTGAFTLTVNGTGFVTGSVVDWNGIPLATTYISGSQLTATVPATKVANPGGSRKA